MTFICVNIFCKLYNIFLINNKKFVAQRFERKITHDGNELVIGYFYEIE